MNPVAAMRYVQIPGTELKTSCLGIGCASLGSRISPSKGRRALDAAYDRGIRWYDVAPSYGAGEAEAILAGFLRSRRQEVLICSKVGLAPPRHNRMIKLAYRLGRPMIGAAQGIRTAFRSVKSTRNVRMALTPELIDASIRNSLSRLGTDYLDVFALHDPDPADLDRDEVLRALEKVKASGAARYLSVAGSIEAATRGAAAGGLFDLFQLADDPLVQPLPSLAARLDRPAGFVTHSVLGVGGVMHHFVARLTADTALMNRLRSAGYGGNAPAVAASLLMRRAFASNPDGVVLASMFSTGHLQQNVDIASQPLDPELITLVGSILADG